MKSISQILFNTTNYSDITVIIDDSKYKLHKIILSESSKYFETLFDFNKDITETTLDVEELDQNMVLDMIKLMYGFDINLNIESRYISYRNVHDFLMITSPHKIPVLKAKTDISYCYDGYEWVYNFSILGKHGIVPKDLVKLLNSYFKIPDLIKYIDCNDNDVTITSSIDVITTKMNSFSTDFGCIYELAYQYILQQLYQE